MRKIKRERECRGRGPVRVELIILSPPHVHVEERKRKNLIYFKIKNLRFFKIKILNIFK